MNEAVTDPKWIVLVHPGYRHGEEPVGIPQEIPPGWGVEPVQGRFAAHSVGCWAASA